MFFNKIKKFFYQGSGGGESTPTMSGDDFFANLRAMKSFLNAQFTYQVSGDKVAMWKFHLSLIMGDIAMQRLPMNDGTMFSFDDFFANMDKVDMLKCWEVNLEMSCEALKDEHAYSDAPAIITSLVGLFVAYTGYEIANGYPLCKSSEKKAFCAMVMKMIDIVGTSVIAIGPDGLSDNMRLGLIVFYAYACAIERRKTMNDIHCVLSMLSECMLAIGGVNFCAPHEIFDYNHVYGPNPYCCVRNLKRPGSVSFDWQDFESKNVYDKVSSMFDKAMALKKEQKAAAEKKAIALRRRMAAENKAIALGRRMAAEKKAKALGRRLAAEEAKLRRKKKRKVVKMRKKALEDLCKNKQGEKTKQVNVKKILYREPKLETVIPEKMDAYRLRRYYEKVEKEQDERRLMRKMLEQAHVLSPSRKREEKIHRRERQEDTHAVWREQKNKHKMACK